MNLTMKVCAVLCCVVLVCLGVGAKKYKAEECEVCVKVIQNFEKGLSTEDRKGGELDQKFRDFCKGLSGPDERFCYSIGGAETSATSSLPLMTKPLSSFMPAEKICQKLYNSDSQICDLRYEKQIDFTQVDLKKLKMKDLKRILSGWSEERACKGCSEKSEFIRVIKQLLPKYEPEAAKILAERDEL